MEKIKHRTIHFSAPKYKRTACTALIAGLVLGAMAVALGTMLIFIFS